MPKLPRVTFDNIIGTLTFLLASKYGRLTNLLMHTTFITKHCLVSLAGWAQRFRHWFWYTPTMKWNTVFTHHLWQNRTMLQWLEYFAADGIVRDQYSSGFYLVCTRYGMTAGFCQRYQKSYPCQFGWRLRKQLPRKHVVLLLPVPTR